MLIINVILLEVITVETGDARRQPGLTLVHVLAFTNAKRLVHTRSTWVSNFL